MATRKRQSKPPAPTPSKKVTEFVEGKCVHGVDHCSACAENNRSDKLFIGFGFGILGLLFGAALATAEPYERRTYVILDDF